MPESWGTILPHNDLPPEIKTRILLVDDNPLILKLLKTSMEIMGHAFDTAADGEEAKGKLPWFSPI